MAWKKYWYARRKELNNPDTKISEYQPQAFIGKNNHYKITHDNFYTKTFYSYRSEIVRAKID